MCRIYGAWENAVNRRSGARPATKREDAVGAPTNVIVRTATAHCDTNRGYILLYVRYVVFCWGYRAVSGRRRRDGILREAP